MKRRELLILMFLVFLRYQSVRLSITFFLQLIEKIWFIITPAGKNLTFILRGWMQGGKPDSSTRKTRIVTRKMICEHQ